MTINTVDLDNYAKTLVEDIVSAIEDEVREAAEKALFDHVNKSVYASPQGSYYDRTFELLDAVEIRNFKVSNRIATFEIGFNNERIRTHTTQRGKLNAHTGVKSNFKSGIDGFLDTMENGGSGSPIFNPPAHGFVDGAYKDLVESLVVVMGRAMTAKGWSVTY